MGFFHRVDVAEPVGSTLFVIPRSTHRGFRASVLLALLATLGCATPYSGFSAHVLAPIDVAAMPPTSKSPATLLLDEQIVRFEETEDGVVAREFARQQTRINTAAGQDHRYVGIGYSNTFTTVEAFDARISLPDGRSERVTEPASDFPSLGSYVLYDDYRRRTLPIPTVPPGSVVEQASILRSSAPELFAYSFFFGSNIPVDAARFVVEAPEGWELDWRNSQPGAAAPRREVVDGRQRLIWERSGLAALRGDRYSSWLGARGELVSVRLKKATRRDGSVLSGPHDDVALSRHNFELMKGQATLTPAMEQVIDEVLGAQWQSIPPRERAGRLYAWTRDSIRYCAVEIGMGGWVPHQAGDVEKLRYGDCKDKANLLHGLLTRVDVPSRLVTIYSSVAPRPFGLPVMAANFNHAILVVDLDDGPHFVDPTTRTVAFGDLPPNDEDRVCLPIAEGGSGLVTTPASSPDTDHRQTTYRLRAAADGMITGDVDVVAAGHFSDHARDTLLETPEAERLKALAEEFSLRQTVLTEVVEHAAPPVFPTPITLRATVEENFGGDDKLLANLLRASDFLDVEVPVLDADRPRDAVHLWARDRIDDDLTLALPPHTRVLQLPDAVAFDGPLVSYELRWSSVAEGERTVLKLRRRRTFHRTHIAPDEVPAFNEALRTYLRAFEARVSLQRLSPDPVSSEH